MIDARLTQLAEVLIKQCLRVQAMEKIEIRVTDHVGVELAKEAYKQAVLLGALPHLDIGVEGLSSWFYHHANLAQVTAEPKIEAYKVKHTDKFLTIVSSVNLANLSNADKGLLQQREKLMRPIKQEIMSKPWVLTEYPTAALAQGAGMNLEQLEDFYFQSVLQDWTAIEQEMKKLAHLFDGAELHIVGEKTDLKMSTRGRTWIFDDWKANMPGGEVFTSPVDDSVEGHVYFNYPLQRQGLMMRGIELWFEKGRVVKAHADENEALLLHLLDTDPGARRLGEIAIGGNPGIQEYMNNVLFDEKMKGTIHMALGQSFKECQGVNASAIHMDMIKNMRSPGSEIYVNGKQVFKDGAFLHE